MQEKSLLLRRGDAFKKNSKPQTVRQQINTFHFIRVRDFFVQPRQDNRDKINTQLNKGEKILAMLKTDKGLRPRIYEELPGISKSRTQLQWRNGRGV